MATLNVGAGQTYATLAAAVAASHDGDVVDVQAGTYVNDFATVSTKISIVGVGGMANFVATEAPPNGKGILVTQTDVTVQNLSFSGAAVADNNGAGIRYEGGNLVVIDSYFHDNQMGLLSDADPDGTIRIVGSEFANTSGPGDGLRHNLYIGNIASVVIEDSYFHDAYDGHQIKSRAQSTTITNSRIYDGTGLGSYSIDLPNGGVGVIRDNVIEQGPNSDNPGIIHYGGESAPYAGSSLTIADNVVVNDRQTSGARLLYNATTVTASISGNDVYGLTSSQITTGPASVSGTTSLSARPSLDTSSPWLHDDSTIFGTSGPDTLAGTTGADTMVGGAGNDIYIVNNVRDVVTELAGEGTDTIKSSVNYTLPANVENLTLTGTGNLNGTGTSLANVLTGNSGDNFLNGKGGADTMKGGAGDDTYYVNNVRDVVSESAGGGTDTIRSSVSYTLPANVENLVLTGTGNINGTGNSLANVLTGNSGNNILNGKNGADTMKGGAGDDTYYVDNPRDTVIEVSGEGTDQVFSSVSYSIAGQAIERLTLLGSENLNADGTALANTLTGNAGNNILDGMAGADVMTGGGGADTFGFTTSLVAGNVDTITDFNVTADKIRLTHTVFNAIAGTGTLSAAQFAANASGTAQDANDRIIYETDTGKLFYDSNGSAAGGATQFAKLSSGLALTANDFSII
jgi:Ca2+-binding RTX toxin-like protein